MNEQHIENSPGGTDVRMTTKKRRLLISLQEEQYAHLLEIKRTHGLSMSAQVRGLIKNDIEAISSSTTEQYQSTTTTTTTIKKSTVQHQKDPQWQSIQQELAPILEKRRHHLDRHLGL